MTLGGAISGSCDATVSMLRTDRLRTDPVFVCVFGDFGDLTDGAGDCIVETVETRRGLAGEETCELLSMAMVWSQRDWLVRV